MKVVIVRHAEAEGNVTNLIMSRNDVPLTARGHQQAQELSQKLASYQFDTLYSSPQARAVDTIKPFASFRHQEIIIDDRLMEIDCGEFIGKPSESTIPILGKDMGELLNDY